MSAIVVENDSRYQMCRQIIRAVANGGKLVERAKALQMDPHEFYILLEKYPDLSQAYTAAQKARAEILAEEVVDIADTDDDSGRARNRIQARQWYAGKINAAKWGDKVQLEVVERISLVDAINEAKGRVLSASYQRIDDEAEVIDSTSLPAPETRDIQSGEAPKGAESIDDLLE